MAHREQLSFVSLIRQRTDLPSRYSVLEIGAYDVNGNIRRIFDNAGQYTGVDLAAGPGVDIIGSGHEVKIEDVFDLTISCECLEHNPYWVETIMNMFSHLRDDGLMVITCATTGRVEHGTSRTNLLHSPGTAAVGIDYYKNLTENDFRENLALDEMFSHYFFHTCRASNDLYFVAQKRGKLDTPRFSFERNDLSSLEKLSARTRGTTRQLLFKLYRFPLDIASSVLPEERYQNIAVPYDNFVNKLRAR